MYEPVSVVVVRSKTENTRCSPPRLDGEDADERDAEADSEADGDRDELQCGLEARQV